MKKLLTLLLLFFTIMPLYGCTNVGYSTNSNYQNHHWNSDPWRNRRPIIRDRVHIITEDEARAIEEIEREIDTMPDTGPDMGMGDMDMGGMDFDF